MAVVVVSTYEFIEIAQCPECGVQWVVPWELDAALRHEAITHAPEACYLRITNRLSPEILIPPFGGYRMVDTSLT